MLTTLRNIALVCGGLFLFSAPAFARPFGPHPWHPYRPGVVFVGPRIGAAFTFGFDPWAPAMVPAYREGWVWVPGYYDVNGVWVPGYYEPATARPGFLWEPGHWEEGVYFEGRWVAVEPGRVWVPGHYLGRAWVTGHWDVVP